MPKLCIQFARPRPNFQNGRMVAPQPIDSGRMFADLRRELGPVLAEKIGPHELELLFGERGEIRVYGFAAKDARKLVEEVLSELMTGFDMSEYQRMDA